MNQKNPIKLKNRYGIQVPTDTSKESMSEYIRKLELAIIKRREEDRARMKQVDELLKKLEVEENMTFQTYGYSDYSCIAMIHH